MNTFRRETTGRGPGHHTREVALELERRAKIWRGRRRRGRSTPSVGPIAMARRACRQVEPHSTMPKYANGITDHGFSHRLSVRRRDLRIRRGGKTRPPSPSAHRISALDEATRAACAPRTLSLRGRGSVIAKSSAMMV